MSLGLAIDCGTSSIELALCETSKQKILATAGLTNPSRRYGSDVLKRAEAAMKNPLAQKNLTEEIWKSIAGAAEEICLSSGFSLKQIEKIAFAANPIVTHLSLGEDPEKLTRYPFTLERHYGKTVDFDLAAFGFSSSASLWIGPLVSAFVGSDALLGYASLRTAPAPILYADLGTNAEFFLETQDRLYAASAAAGPAFEGSEIRCGMRAEPGAVDRVFDKNGRLCCTTIENAPARGFCASGLISFALAAYEAGLILENGLISAGRVCLSDTLCLSTEEVRALLLAKAAFYAGAEALLNRASLSAEEIASCYLAGAFGEHLDRTDAARFGLFPPPLLKCAVPAGSAALFGCARALWDADFALNACQLATRAETLDLAQDSVFLESYITHIPFPKKSST